MENSIDHPDLRPDQKELVHKQFTDFFEQQEEFRSRYNRPNFFPGSEINTPEGKGRIYKVDKDGTVHYVVNGDFTRHVASPSDLLPLNFPEHAPPKK